MLFLNDSFELGGHLHRLLHVNPGADTAWTLDLTDKEAWPTAREWRAIRSLDAASPKHANEPRETLPSKAMIAKRDQALHRLAPLIEAVPKILEPMARSQLIQTRARELPCARTTLYRDLRRWWRGGQTPSALLPNYKTRDEKANALGRKKGAEAKAAKQEPVTEMRGRPGRSPTRQLVQADHAKFDSIVRSHYLADGRVSMRQSYQRLLEKHYVTEDGNGDPFILGPGERPSFRQFEHFVYTRHPFESRLRKRKGDKDFEREHRAILGTVLADCLGVGHYYEADATVADVYLVASDDVRQIIGKPTIYMVVDRKSRLIVGFYVGLENASWVCALQAIQSISQDKAELCNRYGIPYDPNDWPAHGVFPKQFLADRGELLTLASSQIADELAITVTNVPAKRPDWKPVVESGFRLQRRVLEDGIPGFDPPENAKRRQGKKYHHDACLTLEQFSGIILNSIVTHNRSPMLHYDLSLREIGDRVEPTPLALWNHGIIDRAGVLTRYDEQKVRMALLPRGTATVTEHGIEINRCFYSCSAAIANSWMALARRKRFKVTAIFDRRSVDILYVQNPHKPDEIHVCSLTTRSQKFRGFSVAEVEGLFQIERRNAMEHAQQVVQKRFQMHLYNDAQVNAARQKLKELGPTTNRKARRADTKAARGAALRDERAERTGDARSAQSIKNVSKATVQRLRATQAKATNGSREGHRTSTTTSGGTEQTEQAEKQMADALRRMKDQLGGGSPLEIRKADGS